MIHNFGIQSTTHFATYPTSLDTMTRNIKRRLMEISQPGSQGALSTRSDLPDPFMFHLIVLGEVTKANLSSHNIAVHALNAALSGINRYSSEGQSQKARSDLQDRTFKLNEVSQALDARVYIEDYAGMTLRNIENAHHRYRKNVAESKRESDLMKTTDAIQYLETFLEYNRIASRNHRSRKDTAMNLVSVHCKQQNQDMAGFDFIKLFHLVTQQDAAMSATIAQETRADGNAMKTIAALTMLFLPGTFLSSVFGMPSLEKASLRLYFAITIPMTVIVMMIWWSWLNRSEIRATGSKFKRRFQTPQNIDEIPVNLPSQDQMPVHRSQYGERGISSAR